MNSGVGVSVFIPMGVGVVVNVEVGIVGVELGISVGTFVEVAAGVGAANGVNTEQDSSSMTQLGMA